MRRVISLSILVLGSLHLLMAEVPTGWFVAGNDPKEFTVSTDPATYAGKPSVSLRSATANPSGFVTLMQSFLPDGYSGKRVRFSGVIRSDRVDRWAGLWMRVDAGSLVAGFDNMQQRPVKGTTDWTRYSVVMDVPVGTSSVNFGILLDGPGTVWLSGVTFEVVGNEVPVTATFTSPSAPQNLDFQQ
jgi:hypothetical protein